MVPEKAKSGGNKLNAEGIAKTLLSNALFERRLCQWSRQRRGLAKESLRAKRHRNYQKLFKNLCPTAC